MAMEDKAMAANLEKIHQIYMDREEKPVEKVKMINMLLFDDIVMMMSMQAAWWVEYVCRHGTANWLKSIGEEVTRNDGDDWEEVIIETAVRYLTFLV